MASFLRSKQANVFYLLVILALALVVHRNIRPDLGKSTDIFYTYTEGTRLLAGENPYARVLAGDMRTNDKYATYLPLFFLLSAVSTKAGLVDYYQWLAFWRVIFLIFNLATGAVIYYTLYRGAGTLAAIFGALIWFFSRWTMWLTLLNNLEFIPFFFLLLSLWLLFTGCTRRRRLAAYLLLGISLSLKQIALPAVPLYLIWAYQTAPRDRPRAALEAAVAIAGVVLLVSLPFIFWNAEGFVKSLVFSATRDPGGHVAVATVGDRLHLPGMLARLPMAAMWLLTYLLFWRRKIGLYTANLFIIAIFLYYNSVLFLQYFDYAVPFLPLVMVDLANRGWLEPRRWIGGMRIGPVEGA